MRPPPPARPMCASVFAGAVIGAGPPCLECGNGRAAWALLAGRDVPIQLVLQRIQTTPRHGTEHRQGAHRLLQAIGAIGYSLQQVDLAQAEDAFLLQQRRIVLLEFGQQRKVFADGILAARVDQEQQNPGALDVAEELGAEPLPSLAPSMRPGMSAITQAANFAVRTRPRFGTSVVKG